MNKKAQFNILSLFGGIKSLLLIIAIVIFSLAFVLSSNFRIFLIGTALALGGFWLVLTIDNPKIKLTFAIILFGGALILIFASGVLQTTFTSGTYIQAPTFYYYECSPASQPVESNHVTISSGASGWITCPSNTDTCDLWIAQTETTKWYSSDRRIVYQICHTGGRCDNQVYTSATDFRLQNRVPSVHIPNLIIGDKVYINYQYNPLIGSWKDQPNGAEYYNTYKPFILWKVDMFGGGRTEYTTISQGCNFPTSSSQIKSGQTLTTSSGLLNSITNSIKQINTQTSTSSTKLDFYKTRNFIGNYVPISTANVNFVTYNGQSGYCLNRQIFAITTATTNGGTYQIVDSNFNAILANSVECCPNEKEQTRICGNDFKWQIIEEAECSLFKPCQGADWMPDSSKNLIRYNCVNSKCEPETKTVECTTNSDCANNQVCDTKIYECIDVEAGQVDDSSEGSTDDSTCSFYEQKVTTNEKDYGFLYFRAYTPFFEPKTIQVEKCVISNWVYIVGVIIVFIGMIVAIILINKPMRKKR